MIPDPKSLTSVMTYLDKPMWDRRSLDKTSNLVIIKHSSIESLTQLLYGGIRCCSGRLKTKWDMIMDKF